MKIGRTQFRQAFLCCGLKLDPVQSGLSVDHMNPVLISHGPKVERYIIDVPEEVQDSEELVATMLFYHQYPGGCEGNYCDEGSGLSDWYP